MSKRPCAHASCSSDSSMYLRFVLPCTVPVSTVSVAGLVVADAEVLVEIEVVAS